MYEFNEWNVNFNILFVIQRRLKLRKKKRRRRRKWLVKKLIHIIVHCHWSSDLSIMEAKTNNTWQSIILQLRHIIRTYLKIEY